MENISSLHFCWLSRIAQRAPRVRVSAVRTPLSLELLPIHGNLDASRRIEFKASFGERRNFSCPNDGSFRVMVDGFEHWTKCQQSILLVMLEDGVHSVSINVVDTALGKPMVGLPSLAHTFDVNSRRGSLKFTSPLPNSICGDGETLLVDFDYRIQGEHMLGKDFYIQVSVNNGSDTRVFGSFPPYELRGLPTGIVSIRSHLVDVNMAPLFAIESGIALDEVQCVFVVSAEENARREREQRFISSAIMGAVAGSEDAMNALNLLGDSLSQERQEESAQEEVLCKIHVIDKTTGASLAKKMLNFPSAASIRNLVAHVRNTMLKADRVVASIADDDDFEIAETLYSSMRVARFAKRQGGDMFASFTLQVVLNK